MNPKRALDDMRTIKQLLTEAERISREMGQEEPGAEHLLLAAAELPDGSGARALARAGTDAARIGEALVREQEDALVTAGVARERAEQLAVPTPLGSAGAPILYGAGPSAREAFRTATDLARATRQPLAGAHVVAAVATMERGTVARVLERLGVDRQALAEAAEQELEAARA
jgi:ATP-dependent Clp protease ATP-binding subunit ClpA